MAYAVLVFRNSAIRDILNHVVNALPTAGERTVVETPCEARRLLRSRHVDALIVGREFIEDVPGMLDVCPNSMMTMTVLLANKPSPADHARARSNDIALVVDVAMGTWATIELIQGELSDFQLRTHGQPRPARPASLAIWVGNETDREIVEMIAAGYSDREIAAAVCLNHQTVRNHVSRILCESGARNRTHLAAIYLKSVCEGSEPFVAPVGRDGECRPNFQSDDHDAHNSAAINLWR
jgi:DNA-binding CsgD family transcriptional regulator